MLKFPKKNSSIISTMLVKVCTDATLGNEFTIILNNIIL